MVKWGIVGLGNMAHKFAQSINEVDNAQLSGIASLNKNRLSAFKNNFNISGEDSFISHLQKHSVVILVYQFTQVQNQVLLDFQIVCQKSMVDTISRLILFL